MALFLSTDIHQGDERFNILSRGKQCAFMSLSAILTARHSLLIDWSKNTFNNVLLQGEKMYLKAHLDRANYSEQQIHEMPTWIKTNIEEYTVGEQYDTVDVDSFSEMQKLANDIVKSHFDDTSCNKEPLSLIIKGVAGTGKSYLINALRNLLQSKCAVTATTGKTAYNIRGVTVHSFLKLPVGSRGNKDLTGQSLCRLQHSNNGNQSQFLPQRAQSQWGDQ